MGISSLTNTVLATAMQCVIIFADAIPVKQMKSLELINLL